MQRSWADHARETILETHAAIPSDAKLKERMAIIDAAYPFGERRMHPYKMWLKERRKYLARYGYARGQERTPIEEYCEARK